MPHRENGIDTDEADRTTDDARFMVGAVFADSHNNRLEKRHRAERVPTAVGFAKHVM